MGCCMARVTLSRMSKAFGFAIPIVIAFSFASAVGADAGRSDLPAPVDEILWWLPSDTETVMVARGPFKVADVDISGPARDPRNTLRFFTMMGLASRLYEKRTLIGSREMRSLFREADDSGPGLLQRGGWSLTTART